MNRKPRRSGRDGDGLIRRARQLLGLPGDPAVEAQDKPAPGREEVANFILAWLVRDGLEPDPVSVGMLTDAIFERWALVGEQQYRAVLELAGRGVFTNARCGCLYDLQAGCFVHFCEYHAELLT